MDINNYECEQKILVAVDCIIFGFDGDQLKALLIKRGFDPEKSQWSLMGGFIRQNENAEQAAIRILCQLTGLTNVYMEQLCTFSAMDRDPAARVISIAYFALINITDYSEQLQVEHEAKWFSLNELPSLIFDHKEMILKAQERLKDKVTTHPLGFELLPEKFTLSQLQSLYEAIYETRLDKRNFTKKMRSLGILSKLNEKNMESSRKGAFYYRFNNSKYAKSHWSRLKINGN
jgi:ADP-ribose pyrophosphatase YjhB (NUDIX family)